MGHSNASQKSSTAFRLGPKSDTGLYYRPTAVLYSQEKPWYCQLAIPPLSNHGDTPRVRSSLWYILLYITICNLQVSDLSLWNSADGAVPMQGPHYHVRKLADCTVTYDTQAKNNSG